MSNTYLIHVDTGSAQTVTSPQSYSVNGVLNTYPGQPSVNKVNGNPFQCSVILGNRHRRIRSISLKNAQIPIGFYNVRAPYNTMNVNSIVYTVPPGNYSSVSFLATLNTTIGNSVGVFAVGLATNSITFTSGAGSGSVTMNVTPLSTLSFLGFTNGQVGTFITATNSYIINFDTYLNIWIENLGQSSLEPSQITFKLPLNVNSGGILQWTELSQHTQKVEVTDRGVRLDRLNITVLDRYGNILNNNGIDWSFTLEIEADT
jgi:hypothetical protein